LNNSRILECFDLVFHPSWVEHKDRAGDEVINQTSDRIAIGVHGITGGIREFVSGE
jgi:hypothetical protein